MPEDNELQCAMVSGSGQLPFSAWLQRRLGHQGCELHHIVQHPTPPILIHRSPLRLSRQVPRSSNALVLAETRGRWVMGLWLWSRTLTRVKTRHSHPLVDAVMNWHGTATAKRCGCISLAATVWPRFEGLEGRSCLQNPLKMDFERRSRTRESRKKR